MLSAVALGSSCAPVRLGFGAPWAVCTGRPENDAPLLSLALGLSERVASATLLKSLQLTRAEERALLNLNAGRGVLLPFKNIDRQANELVVFVHGLHGPVRDFEAIVEEFERGAARRQLAFFLYDDSNRSLDGSGFDLARALVTLRDEVYDARPLGVRLIAHSMGGVISRAAMNWLVAPQWLPFASDARSPQSLSRPTAFSKVRLTAIDTPWHGFEGPPGSFRDWLPFESALADMISDLHELTDLELTESRHALSTGDAGLLSGKAGLRNLISALIGSERFDALQARVNDACSNACLRGELAAAVPSFPGGHFPVLRERSLIAALQP